MAFRIEYWRLQPLELPVVWRHCAACGTLRAFSCSERFRANAQKKVLDVWLLYRCVDCEGVWKLPILERRRVSEIAPELRAAFENNDAATAWRYGLDVALLRPHVVRLEMSERLRIERRVETGNGSLRGDLIRVAAPSACTLRLERLLAQQLALPRSDLQRRVARGELLLEPGHPSALRKPVRDGQQVCFVGGIERMAVIPMP